MKHHLNSSKDAYNLTQSVVEKRLPFVILGSSCRRGAFLVRFGVSLILCIHPGGVPWLHGYGRNVAKWLGFLQDDPNLTKRRSVSITLKLSIKLKASLEVCSMLNTQQACN